MRLLRHIISTLALCAVLCVPSHADSPQLDTLASQITGMSVTVQCYPDGEIPQGITKSPAGWVELGTPVIHLQGSDCGALQNVLTPGPRTAHWLHTVPAGAVVGGALQTLGHEAMHLALNSANEAHVECTAYLNVWTFTQYLGLDSTARHLVYLGAYWRHSGIKDPVYIERCQGWMP